MRNGDKAGAQRFPGIVLLLLLATIASAAGCAGPRGERRQREARATQQPQLVLDAGYAALEQQNHHEAIARAEQFLAGRPHGEGSAEALYLKGRALEAKNAAGVTEEESRQNLQAARTAYLQALERNPQQPLQSYLRASLGNVAYFQDDYPTAIAQLSAALDGLDSPEVRAWAHYRIGLSQQRLGRFEQADETFAAVQQQHPGSEPARRAQQHQGARAFYVQLATFASPATADKAVAELKRQGVAATRVPGTEGRAVVRAGPVASYGQAQYLRTRFADQYPDALILP